MLYYQIGDNKITIDASQVDFVDVQVIASKFKKDNLKLIFIEDSTFVPSEKIIHHFIKIAGFYSDEGLQESIKNHQKGKKND